LLRYPRISSCSSSIISKRTLHLTSESSRSLLKQYNIDLSSNKPDSKSQIAGITIHRTARSPCILVSQTENYSDAIKIPFDFLKGPEEQHFSEAIAHLNLPENNHASFRDLIANIWTLFLAKDGITLLLNLYPSPSSHSPLGTAFHTLQFDDSAFRVGKRHAELHSLRDTSLSDPLDLAAEPYGIAYVRLGGKDPSYNVGTLVNGAGLAMNAVDALTARGVHSTNFCDTGGLATSATVAAAFGLLLADERVKVIFVNIFGGLTLGDMIARGVLIAFQEKEVGVPVVVRIRGTNEMEGQKVIAESGLKVFAFDDFEEAVAKIKELLGENSLSS
jgi:succinyl-CoA synthetase alpha subunit